MSAEVRALGPADGPVLENVAPGVFDHAVDPARSAEFLRDPRHHLVVAMDGGQVVGFASGVHYVHPDKPPELWINEVGVSPAHRGQGIGRAVLQALLERAGTLGCREAWVLTDRSNGAAMRLYPAAGGHEEPGETVMFTFFLNRPGEDSGTHSR